MNDNSWSVRIPQMRHKRLNVNRQLFAGLLGFTVKPVSGWENGTASPDALGEVILELLENALNVQPREVVLGTLRQMGSDHLSRVRMLAWMERHDPIPQPILELTVTPSFPIGSEPGSWPRQIKHLRASLDLNQQNFASLIGVTTATVNRWENGLAVPSDLSAVILVLLANALHGHNINVMGPLIEAAGKMLPLVRALTWLERHPVHMAPLLVFSSVPPPSTRPPPFATRVPTARLRR